MDWETAIRQTPGLVTGRRQLATLRAELPSLAGGTYLTERKALIELMPDGRILLLPEPGQGDMHWSWSRVVGETLQNLSDPKDADRAHVYVWPVKNADIMSWFAGPSELIVSKTPAPEPQSVEDEEACPSP